MHCRECGNHVSENSEFCYHCGFRPLNSNRYCQGCGTETKEHQELCIQCGVALRRINTKNYAGFWLRYVASVIDSFIISMPLFFLMIIGFFVVIGYYETNYIYYDEDTLLVMFQLSSYLVSFIVGVLYFALMHSSKWQATIGKKIVGIKVTDLHGGRITFLQGVWRYIGMFISALILYIGYIMAGFTNKKQALHDKMAKTLVIKAK